MPAGDPLVVVHDLVADDGGVAVSGVDHGVGGQLAQLLRDGRQDGREVGEGPSGGSGTTVEQGVAADHGAQVRRVPTHRPRRVAGGVQCADLDVACGEYEAVVHAAEVLVRMG